MMFKSFVIPATFVVLFAGGNAYAASCVTASQGTSQWQNQSFASQNRVFSFNVSAQPQTANGDMLVALSNGAKTNWSGLAAIVRFNNANKIDVRDGSVYRADRNADYVPGETYHFRFEVDVPNKRYSVYYKYSGSSPWYWPLAYNYAFRTEQQGVTSLNNFVAEAEVGTLNACPSEPQRWKTATAGAQQWTNTPFGYNLPTFGAHAPLSWQVRPTAANADLLLALSDGPKTNWSGLAAIVRFSRNNTIDVRDGGVYRADTVIPYLPNQTYGVYMFVDMPRDGMPGRYTVWIAPPKQPAIRIADGYAFRTEQQYVTKIDNWVLEAEVGGVSAELWDGKSP